MRIKFLLLLILIIFIGGECKTKFHSLVPLQTYINEECGFRFDYPRNWTIRKHHYGYEKDICSIEVLRPNNDPDYPGPQRRVYILFTSEGGDNGYTFSWYKDCQNQFVEIRDNEGLDAAIRWKDINCPSRHADDLNDVVSIIGEPIEMHSGVGGSKLIYYKTSTYSHETAGTYYLQSGERIVEISGTDIPSGNIIAETFEFIDAKRE